MLTLLPTRYYGCIMGECYYPLFGSLVKETDK